MKKYFIFLLSCSVMVGCSKAEDQQAAPEAAEEAATEQTAAGDYSDVKASMHKMMKMQREFAESIQASETGQEVADAISVLADKMKPAIEEMEELREKYPELDSPENAPEEIQELMMEMQQEAMQFGQTMMQKLMQFAEDPAVAEALEKLSSIQPPPPPGPRGAPGHGQNAHEGHMHEAPSEQ